MNRLNLYILIGMMLFVAACSGLAVEEVQISPTATEKPPEVFYTINVAADPAEGGAVAPSEDQVPAGTRVQVQARAAPGYHFEVWSGSDSSTSADMTVTMDKDKTITAHFSRLETPTPLPPTITPTPEHSPTPEVEPTSENPWVLEVWCETHVGCERLEVKNKTDYWISIFLKSFDSGNSKLFSIPTRGHAWITLKPGRYHYIITTCGGTNIHEGDHALSSNWFLQYKQNWCK